MRKLPLFAFLLIATSCLLIWLFGDVWFPDTRFQPVTPPIATKGDLSNSRFPVAVNPTLVGSYPHLVKSGAGYFYDEVLEYRVWTDPQSGGKDLNNGSDYFQAFATYEQALRHSESEAGSEPPLALVRQVEYVNEPEEGVFEHIKVERLTEWRVEWLEGSRRLENSIPDFLASKAAAKE